MSHEPNRLAADDRVGSRFGEYRIDYLVGIGGMGKVYRATAEDGTPVALKLVKDDLARDVNFRSRFEREARIAQTVRNPHVVSLRDTGEHDGQPYLATHFIEGMSLEQRLERDGRLDVATVVRICIQVADGLQALWAAGMVHRDIKPGNILIGDDGRAYITDFGLAKDHQATVALTRPGQALGSMDYMSPEQIRGETVTGATDVYSLGCVTFECVDGRPPFADHEGMRALWAHLQEEPREPCPDRADVPQAFRETIKAALRKEPAERPATSVEYARSLAQAAGVPIEDGTS
jgi:serine/threonine-protein kinase